MVDPDGYCRAPPGAEQVTDPADVEVLPAVHCVDAAPDVLVVAVVAAVGLMLVAEGM